jgi:hypothetical protein
MPTFANPKEVKMIATLTAHTVDSLDLTPVLEDVRHDNDWNPGRTALAEVWYRRFLYLNRLGEGPIGLIHPDADVIWHAHILRTAKYITDCDHLFGHYLQHTPGRFEPAVANARRLYKREFPDLFAEVLTDDCWAFTANGDLTSECWAVW